MITKDIVNSKSYLWGLIKSESKPAAPVKASGGSGVIIQQLTKEYADRTRAEISKWRQAIDAADNPEDPRWNLLQDLFENLKSDGHLSSVMEIRKSATLSTRFIVKDLKTGKEIPEQTALLQTEWFYNLIDHLLDTAFFGFTVMELVDPVTLKWELIPRRNCAPQPGMVYFEVGGNKGVNYTDPAFYRNVVELKSIKKFGLFNDIIPQLIWKRNAQQTWADFSERFGIPLVTAETTKTDKKALDAIEAQLRALGQAAQAILPEGTKIVIHDSVQKGDPHKIFLEQINLANAEISKPIVGGTMISDNGSSRSQSEVHERTLDEKIAEKDRRMIEFFVNGKLIPILRTWGIKFTDNSVFEFDRTESISLKDHWTIVKEALETYEINPEWVSNTFNIPIISKKEVAAAPVPPKSPKSAFSSNFR